MAFFLGFMEVWRNKTRYLLFSLVIALITILVLFIAALSEGLALANKEYLSKLDAELLLFQRTAELSPSASRIERSKLNDIRRIEGVIDVGPIGFSSASIESINQNTLDEPLKISLVGVEGGKPGNPPARTGKTIEVDRGSDCVVDGNIVSDLGIKVGDKIQIKTIQNEKEKYYTLNVIGLTDGRKYLYQPSVFVPYRTWDAIRAQGMQSGSSLMELVSNMVAVKIANTTDIDTVINRLESQISDIQAVDVKTAYESLPGYSAQQNTLDTQRGFTLLIGVLVIGGFFQIQMLQKVPQIGVLKAIGASNLTVAVSAIIQIIFVTSFGVFLGSIISLGLAALLPSNIPIVFEGNTVVLAVISLLAIGPIGGMISVRLALKVEPLLALGLNQ